MYDLIEQQRRAKLYLALFGELMDLTPDGIAVKFHQDGYRMPHPITHQDICRTGVLAQWIEKKTGRTVFAGTTSFTFDNEEGILYYPPDNVCRFAAGTFTGKYKDLYLPKEQKNESKHQECPVNPQEMEGGGTEGKGMGGTVNQTTQSTEQEGS